MLINGDRPYLVLQFWEGAEEAYDLGDAAFVVEFSVVNSGGQYVSSGAAHFPCEAE